MKKLKVIAFFCFLCLLCVLGLKGTFWQEKRFSLAFVEDNETVKDMAYNLIYELNRLGFPKKALAGKKVDVYAAHFASFPIPKIKNKEHYNILWLGSDKRLNFPAIAAFDAVFASTPDLRVTLEETGIKSFLLMPFAPSEGKASKCGGNFFDKECFFVVIGDEPEVIKILEKKNIPYRFFTHADDKVIRELFPLFDKISGIGVGNALFSDKGMDVSPFFFMAAVRQIPLFANALYQVDDDDKNYWMSLFNDTVNYYMYKSDLYDVFERPSVAKQKAVEARELVEGYFSSKAAAKRMGAALLKEDEKPVLGANSVGIISSTFPGMYNNGDYWIAKDLQEAFYKEGQKSQISFPNSVVTDMGEANIYIRGGIPVEEDKKTKTGVRVLYLLFPSFEPEEEDNASLNHEEFLNKFKDEFLNVDAVAVASYAVYEKLKLMGVRAYYIAQFTNPDKFYPDYDEALKSEVLFVGNNSYYRKAAKIALLHHLPLTLFGSGWDGMEVAPYIDNRILRKYYASAKIVLNDTRDGMKRLGFIINRIFDVTAAGGFVISDYMKEIEDIYGDTVPMWKTEEELVALINYYLDPKHEEERKDKARRAREITLQNFTADKAVQKFRDIFKAILEEKKAN